MVHMRDETLAQWATRNKVHVQSHESGCKVVVAADKTPDMFDLCDYVVSSHTGGAYWLRKRDEETRITFYENQGMTRSDAQGTVMMQDMP